MNNRYSFHFFRLEGELTVLYQPYFFLHMLPCWLLVWQFLSLIFVLVSIKSNFWTNLNDTLLTSEFFGNTMFLGIIWMGTVIICLKWLSQCNIVNELLKSGMWIVIIVLTYVYFIHILKTCVPLLHVQRPWPCGLSWSAFFVFISFSFHLSLTKRN